MRPEMDGYPPPYGRDLNRNVPTDLPGVAWFHHADRILELLDRFQPKDCVELGTYLGSSAIPIARCVRKWGGRLTCIDLWDNDASIQMCADNFHAYDVTQDIAMIRGNTHLIPNWRQVVDFVYVDGSHYHDTTLLDLQVWWPRLSSGGVICGDGYGRIGETKENGCACMDAWKEFAAAVGVELHESLTDGVPGFLPWMVKP